nr:hypothetical protein [Gemmata obscuriglobus]
MQLHQFLVARLQPPERKAEPSNTSLSLAFTVEILTMFLMVVVWRRRRENIFQVGFSLKALSLETNPFKGLVTGDGAEIRRATGCPVSVVATGLDGLDEDCLQGVFRILREPGTSHNTEHGPGNLAAQPPGSGIGISLGVVGTEADLLSQGREERGEVHRSRNLICTDRHDVLLPSFEKSGHEGSKLNARPDGVARVQVGSLRAARRDSGSDDKATDRHAR